MRASRRSSQKIERVCNRNTGGGGSVREDTAKYLLHLYLNSAYYDPKSQLKYQTRERIIDKYRNAAAAGEEVLPGELFLGQCEKEEVECGCVGRKRNRLN